MLNSITLTDLETAMLKRIQNLEVDGIGMGFSEFDGYNLTPQEKGVLSSLIQKGIVYDSTDGDQDFPTPMYCSSSKAPRLHDEESEHPKLDAILQNDRATLREFLSDAQQRVAEKVADKFPLGTEGQGWAKIQKAKDQIIEEVKKELNVDLHDEEYQELQSIIDGEVYDHRLELIRDICHLSFDYGCEWRYEDLYKANRKAFKWSKYFTKKDGKYYSKAPMFGLEDGELVAEKVAGGWWNVTRYGSHLNSPDSLVDIVRDYEVDLERAKSIAKDDIKTQIERIGHTQLDDKRGLSDAEIELLISEVESEGAKQELYTFKDDSVRPIKEEDGKTYLNDPTYLIAPTTYQIAQQRLKMHQETKKAFSRQSYYQNQLAKINEEACKMKDALEMNLRILQEFDENRAELIDRIESGEIVYK